MSKSLLLVSVVAVVAVFGCASTYYKVTDLVTGNVYYTDEVEREKGGAATIKDARSGAVLTIQNSEIMEIEKDEYNT